MGDGVFRQIVLRILYSPVTYVPAMAGVTVSAGSWAVGKPLGFFPVVLGFLGSALLAGTRIFFPSDKVVGRLTTAIEEGKIQAREEELDALDKELSADRDSRDEDLLRQLRDLMDSFSKNQAWKTRFDSLTVSKMTLSVREMFEHCVELLRRNLALKNEAKAVRSRKTRDMKMAERDKLLTEIAESVAEFRSVIEELQGLHSGSDSRLTQLTAQLRSSLETGKRVQERMDTLRREAQ